MFWGKEKVIGGYRFLPCVKYGKVDCFAIVNPNMSDNFKLINNQVIERYIGEPYEKWLSKEEILSEFSIKDLINELSNRM